jgi:hypothetical protein
MNTRNKIASLVGGAAMIATIVGMTAGLAPASAAPRQEGATMTLVADTLYPENYLVNIYGAYPMERADAQGYLNNINNGKCKGGITYGVYSDDGHNNIVHSQSFGGEHGDIRGFLKATSRGLDYRREFSLQKSLFNEDDGVFDDTDEIYAQAFFTDSDCNIRVQTSQVIAREL